MAFESLKQELRDVAFTAPTPFTPDGERIDDEALVEHVSWLREAGARVLIPCGNTGEYYSLSNPERIEAVEKTVEAMEGDGTVVGGAGGSKKNVVDLAHEYEEAGADGILVMYPSHTYLHEDGVREYYEEIAANTDLGVILYKRGDQLSDSVIQDLSTIDNVVAVKYAVNDIASFTATVENTPGDVVFSTGIAERFAPSFAAEGAEGFTTGLGAFLPNAALDLMEALRAGEYDRAREIRDVLWPIEEFRDETGPGNHMEAANNVPAVKHGIELMGIYESPVREPLVDLTESDRERLEGHIETAQSKL